MRPIPSLRRARGFSLAELMIASGIGLAILAALSTMFVKNTRAQQAVEQAHRQVENGRYAIDRIAEDLRHAGYFSEYYQLPSPGQAGFPATTAAAQPCATAVTDLPAGMPLAIQAYDGGGSVPAEVAACLSAADYKTGTDVLVVRRASTSTIAKSDPAVVGTQPYIQVNSPMFAPPNYVMDLGSNTGSFTLRFPTTNSSGVADAMLRRYMVRIYFVSKCNVPASGLTCNGVSDDGGTPIPTLKMLELGPGPAFQKLALAEGIEELQFDFGIDDQPAAVNPATGFVGDGVADRLSMCDGASPCSTTDWHNVVSVQINLVARNTERSPGYTDDKTYSLGLKGYTAAPGDPYRRHAYSTFVRLNNTSMRRE